MVHGLAAIHIGQTNIQKNQVSLLFTHPIQSLLTGLGQLDGIAVETQNLFEIFRICRIVLDHEDIS